MDSTQLYEKIFQSAEWSRYTRKSKLKQKIKKRREVQILTPRSSEYISCISSGRVTNTERANLDSENKHLDVGQQTVQDLQEEALVVSETNLVFEAINEMQNSCSTTCELDVYIGQIWPELAPWLYGYCIPTPIFDYKNFEPVQNFLLDRYKIMRQIIEQTMAPYCSKENNVCEVELTPDTRTTSEILKEINIEKLIRWHYKKEHLGKLAKTSEGYLLDGLNIGTKMAVEGKIKQCMEMLDRDYLTPKQQLEKALLPCGLYGNVDVLVKREKRAAKLMKDMLGSDAFERLICDGYVCVKSRDRKDYKIDLSGDVFSLPDEDYICLMTAQPVPLLDEILAKYLFFRDGSQEEIDSALEDARNFQQPAEDNQNIDYLEEYKARKNASYDVDLDGRITGISLEEQGEKVN